MGTSSRDRLSVDLHGLKAALLERAHALRMTPSGFVRTTLAEALGRPVDVAAEESTPAQRSSSCGPDRVRLCLRMRRDHVQATMAAARRARMTPSEYVGGLALGVPVLQAGGSRDDHLAALIASSAELSTLSRNLYRLTALLRQADIEPARQYRQMLDTLAAEVRSHLESAARALTELQPRRQRVSVPTRPGDSIKGARDA